MEKTPYTPDLRDVFLFARKEADRLGHDYIGPEHYMLGILKENGVGCQVLSKLNVNAEDLQLQIEESLRDRKTPAELSSLIQKSRMIFDRSREMSRLLKHEWIGTEHLLLAMIKDAESIPGDLLAKLGVEMEDSISAVLCVIDEAK